MSQIVEFFTTRPILFAAAIVVASIIAALIVNLITVRILMRLAAKTATNLDDEIIAAIRFPLFMTVVLIGIAIAFGRLVSSASVVSVFNTIFVTLAILFWMKAGMRIGKAVLGSISRQAGQNKAIQPRTLPLFEIMMKTLVVGGAAYGICLAWKVDVTAWLASAGILGIAIGFAAKDTLSNLFAGIFILADAPYKIGDFIVLDSGERGQVTDIGIRSTRILTRDDIQIIVPNAAIGSSKVVNETGGPYEKERVRVKVGVAYGSDVDQVNRVLMDVAVNCKWVTKSPEPRVRFRAFGDSSLNFELLAWIEEPLFRGRALNELNTQTYKRFAKEGINIPFPQRDLHMISK